jgi:adenylosuccinate synthase
MKNIIVIGLGFGDEGKGTIVDSLVRRHNIGVVVRFNGGFQAAHNVHTEEGKHHTFSQFGSGTLAGADTFIGPDVIINPLAMQVEAKVLEDIGIRNPLKRVTVNGACKITTPFHKALNQIRELSRKYPHGSTGTGIGETVRLSLTNCEKLILRAGDIVTDAIEVKLNHIRCELYRDCIELINDYGLHGDLVKKALAPFFMIDGIKVLQERYSDWSKQVNLCRPASSLFTEKLYSYGDMVVFEGSQGVLLDKKYGFHPHTTWSDTTAHYASSLIPFFSESYVIGVTRTYMTRHGNGPFVTEHFHKPYPPLTGDDDNKYQPFTGEFRSGYPDLIALKYAIKCCGGIDALALTHCDKLTNRTTHQVCVGYDGADLLSYSAAEASIEAMEFTNKLLATKPIFKEVEDVPSFLAQELKVPIIIQSFGKTHKQKQYMGLQPEDEFVALPKKVAAVIEHSLPEAPTEPAPVVQTESATETVPAPTPTA